MSDKEYDPSLAPAALLMWHILQKGFQAGSVLGTGLIGPTQAAWQSIKNRQSFNTLQLIGTAGRTTAAVFGLTAALGAARTSQLDKEGLEDRAYRLHYNQGQNRTDAFTQIGALGGLAAGVMLLRGSAGATAVHYLGATSAGAALGVLAHVLTRPKDL